MFADANQVNELLEFWRKTMGGYQTRFEVIEHMLQAHSYEVVKIAITAIGRQQATSPVGVDGLIDRVNTLLGEQR